MEIHQLANMAARLACREFAHHITQVHHHGHQGRSARLAAQHGNAQRQAVQKVNVQAPLNGQGAYGTAPDGHAG